MEFEIVIHIHNKPYRMQAKRIYQDNLVKRYEVKGGKAQSSFGVMGLN